MQNKYKNIKCEVDGITFQSKKEANRWCELKILLRAGIISNLDRQVKFVLIPKSGKERAVCYIADFTYFEHGNFVVEDVKSKATKTRVYEIKKKLLRERHGIEIMEV